MSRPPAPMPGGHQQAIEPAYLTADDVAEMLQINRATVFRWVKRDPTLPALVVGGIVRFPRERFVTWLRARERGRVARGADEQGPIGNGRYSQ